MKKISFVLLLSVCLIILTACNTDMHINQPEPSEFTMHEPDYATEQTVSSNDIRETTNDSETALEMPTIDVNYGKEVPESRPRLYLVFETENSSLQYFESAQLSGSWGWSCIGADHCTEGGYSASADHPLDFWIAEEWTQDILDRYLVYLNSTEGRVELQFSDDFLPHTIYVRRWHEEFLGQGASDIIFQYESIELDGHTFYITNDGHDYIYEVRAIWAQGNSSYTFRINSNNE